MEFEENGMNESMPNTESDISGVENGASQTVNDPDGLLDGFDADGDGLVFSLPFDNPVAGTNSDDVVSGTDADNFILPGTGNDEVDAGNGDDSIITASGFDTIDGGEGNDTILFGSRTTRIDLNAGEVIFAGAPDQTGVITNVENVIASEGDDVIIGNTADNGLDGGLGFDTIDGGAGTDTAIFETVLVSADANLATGRVTFATESTDFAGDVLINIENVTTGTADDVLTGNDGNNVLSANVGDDILEGGLGDDTLDGFEGNDTYVFTPGASGADLITGFEDGVERLDVSAFDFDDNTLGSVIEGAQQIDGDALLTFEENNTVLLRGTQVTAIDASDFIT